MTGKLQQIIGHCFVAQHRRAADAEGLAEGNHQQLRAHRLRGAAPASFVADHANTVGVIHQQHCPCGLRRGVNGRQRRAVAVHAENAFSDRQLFARQRLSQQLRELLRIVVGKAAQLRRAEACRLQQGGMAQAIGDNPIVFFHQGGDQRLIRGKAGDKQQCARIAQPVGERLFQRAVGFAIAAHVARAAGTDAIARGPLLPGGDNRRMLTQAQIVIAGEVKPALPFPLQPAPGAVRPRQAAAKSRPPLVQRPIDSLLPAHSAAAL